MNNTNFYLVGGAVRDQLLGITSNDLDYVVICTTPEQMIEAGFKPIHAQEFPIFTKDDNEYALARKEVKNGKGYRGFDVFTDINVTLEEDLLRRDLTINSIAINHLGEYIDPYNGIGDIENKILRHTSDAFKEDPVRILRICRFASRFSDFTICDETMTLMKQMVIDGEVNDLTAERIWKETEKALWGDSPWIYFEQLNKCGALEIVFPELFILTEYPFRSVDLFQHTMMDVLKQVAIKNDAVMNFAALTHNFKRFSVNYEYYIESMCGRLKTPKTFKQFALVSTRNFDSVCINVLNAPRAFYVLNDICTFKQTKYEFMCRIFDFYKLVVKESKYIGCDAEANIKLLDRLYNETINIDYVDIVKNFKGSAINDNIKKLRIAKIAELLSGNMDDELSFNDRIALAVRFYGLYTLAMPPSTASDKCDYVCAMDNMRVPYKKSQLRPEYQEYLNEYPSIISKLKDWVVPVEYNAAEFDEFVKPWKHLFA